MHEVDDCPRLLAPPASALCGRPEVVREPLGRGVCFCWAVCSSKRSGCACGVHEQAADLGDMKRFI
eukprot:1159054-Pelagomonas_calceolata.AAC.11